MSESQLVITGLEVTPYSARGLTQSLDPIPQAINMRRTINGTLVNVAASEFQKFRSVITCNDQAVPAIDGIWPGQTVTVDCVAELSYRTSGGSPAKTVVAGSTYTDGDFTFYRPQLTMMVINYTTEKDEAGAVVSWTLELEEI